MSVRFRIRAAAWLGLSLAAGAAAAGDAATSIPSRTRIDTPVTTTTEAIDGASARPTSPFAKAAISDLKLAGKRGGSTQSAASDQQATLRNTTATQVETGANTIRDTAFSGAMGLTTVIQNSGANVLIQNSTVLNVQLR